MLMNNYLGYKYVVTNITELARTHPNKLLQLNEMFLKDRPVNRLNIGVDARVCETCLINSERRAKIMRNGQRIACNVFCCVLAGNCKKSISVEDCGKLRIYVRNSNKKYSGRLLWYPTTDVKFECVGEVTRFLKSVLSAAAARKVLKQLLEVADTGKPVAYTCTSCKERIQIDKSNGAPTKNRHRFVLDVAPYAVHKSIRLPNVSKDGEQFRYIATLNDFYAGDSENYESMAVGISSLIRTPDTQIINIKPPLPWRSQTVRRQKKLVYMGSNNTKYMEWFSNMWNVNVKTSVSGKGLFIIEATDTSKFPCPHHGYVHRRIKLRVFVYSATDYKYVCFK